MCLPGNGTAGNVLHIMPQHTKEKRLDCSPKKALELAAFSTKAERFGDWWWKARLGKCYYQLGLFRRVGCLQCCQ